MKHVFTLSFVCRKSIPGNLRQNIKPRLRIPNPSASMLHWKQFWIFSPNDILIQMSTSSDIVMVYLIYSTDNQNLTNTFASNEKLIRRTESTYKILGRSFMVYLTIDFL